MQIGILVMDEQYLKHLIGFSKAALGQGYTLKIFINDQGVKLLHEPALLELAESGAGISFCETSARKFKIDLQTVPRKIKRGTQLQHAMLQQRSDRILVF
ncbi:MAG: hypothetical protein A2508_05470 [Candidatus Lambdaproteobacteria bacterium RIFOXYD12_FULL_49_8]|uniref:Uncharacterized protein n=1 Tax=Candidatus Lambdaproteobacteria bacterium RIFOXYD2_FULL_50_16 TaxID=1817772 RepID=A0A1F6GAP4_9PROT|nr:MAG: hypothetical protein A2527_08280 [Candidatus Lambdaproteobacteria bacterium RIFOXYD2_FULL_50_16]OGG97071.1 MAG: hypothetical protein A2508_05470 [Candidatus Lambdaproteobacteria bacterium RIFOXYD12_FULL_49_8]